MSIPTADNADMDKPATDAPIYQQIQSVLVDRILQGKYAPGEVFPSEAELCEEFDSSRGPVRQALEALRNSGYISSMRGRRSRVIPRPTKSNAPIYVSFTKWASLMGKKCVCFVAHSGVPFSRPDWSLDAANGEFTDGVSDEGLAKAPFAQPAVSEGERSESSSLNGLIVERHYHLEGSPILWEQSWYPPAVASQGSEAKRLRYKGSVDFSSGDEDFYQELEKVVRELFQITHTIDCVEAPAPACNFWGMPPGALALREQRTLLGTEGEVIERSIRFFRAGAVSFVVTSQGEEKACLSIAIND